MVLMTNSDEAKHLNTAANGRTQTVNRTDI